MCSVLRDKAITKNWDKNELKRKRKDKGMNISLTELSIFAQEGIYYTLPKMLQRLINSLPPSK